jgi:hypothetical protein
MSYDNLSSVYQNVLKFYQQLTGEERRIPFIFDDFHFCHSRIINTTQVIIRHRVKILFSVISSPITLEQLKWKSSKMKGILLSSPVSSELLDLIWRKIGFLPYVASMITCWLILSVYIIMSFDFPFVRLFGVR